MQLHIEFGGDGLTLPLHYRPLIHGLIYSLLGGSQDIAQLHSSRQIKGFTFGPIEGVFAIEGKTIRFASGAGLEIRTCDQKLMQGLVNGLMQSNVLHLGKATVPVARWTVGDVHYKVRSAQIIMRSPAVAYVTEQDGHTRFYSPDQDDFFRALQHNAQRKWQQFGDGSPYELNVRMIPSCKPRKVFDIFRQTYITGYTGVYQLFGTPEVIDLLYQVGLGAKNSEGFGMFDVRCQKKPSGERRFCPIPERDTEDTGST